jgi:hypothetical protein
MASKKTLNAVNLETLGATRLAELLIEISAGDATAKRRLRLELAGEDGPLEVAKEIKKRLATIARSKSFVDWQNIDDLYDDLDAQRKAIMEFVAEFDPVAALDLMWLFLKLSPSVFERCDDSNGDIGHVFFLACSNLGEIARLRPFDKKNLANHIFEALANNNYGQYSSLLESLHKELGNEGLEYLKQKILTIQLLNTPDAKDRFKNYWIKEKLKEIADLQGDIDGFIAQHDEQEKKIPYSATLIAKRLFAVGRYTEAWQIIENTELSLSGASQEEWKSIRIDLLDALDRGEEAQNARWACFEQTLSINHLKNWLKRHDNSDSFDLEEKAFNYAAQFQSCYVAIAFFLSWPALDWLSALIIKRSSELDGNLYEMLVSVADDLMEKYPLAATITLRAMIDFSLVASKATRYKHAAKHLSTCAFLAKKIQNFGTFPDHNSYCANLRLTHAKKASFWTHVQS